MRRVKWIPALLSAVMIMLWCCPALAAPEEAELSLTAKAAILIEPESGEVLFEQNADEPLPIASVTKVMTLLLTLEALEEGTLDLNDTLIASANAAGMGGSQVLIDEGGHYTVSDMIKSMIVASGNDASVLIAETLAGSEEAFAERMNARAKELGMENTHFVNCTGLPAEGHYSSARDVAMMSAALIRHPVYFDYSSIKLDYLRHETGRETMLSNTNRLLKTYAGADGIKTGSTSQAGYCLSATAKRDDRRFIAVILGAESTDRRFDEAAQLLDFGFDHFERRSVVRMGDGFGSVAIKNGKREFVTLEAGEGFSVVERREDPKQLSVEATLPDSFDAPVAKGQRLGEVTVKEGDRVLAKLPLCAERSVLRASFRDRLDRVVARWLHLSGPKRD